MTDGMTDMWRATLDRAVMDARGEHLLGEDPDLARASVAAWVGTPDFDEVCHLAGVDPDQTRRLMEAEIA